MAKYKKNYLNGSLANEFSSNVNNKFNYLMSNIIDAHYDYLLTSPKNDFKAIVLSGMKSGQNNGSGPNINDAKVVERNVGDSINRHLSIKIRPIDIRGSTLPDPINTQNNKDQDFLIGMHEWAISDVPIGDDMPTINAGDEVSCYYTDGREMGFSEKQLFFKSREIGSSYLSRLAQGFADAGSSVAGLFSSQQEIATLGDPKTPVVRGSKIYSLQGYREIARRLNNNVMKNIRNHESNNKPTISNYGYTTYAMEFPEFETYTVDQIRQIQESGMFNGKNYKKPGTTATPFAVGLYQIIPDTMDWIRGAVPAVRNLKFTRDTQHILGAILIMNKRPVMGNYLLGKHKNIIEAGQNWAYEWAYAPSQYDTKRRVKKGPPPQYIGVPMGASYYTDSGGNRAGTDPSTIRSELKAGRTAMQGFSGTTPDAFGESDPNAIQDFLTSTPELGPYGLPTPTTAAELITEGLDVFNDLLSSESFDPYGTSEQ